jgi:hypothetical protein
LGLPDLVILALLHELITLYRKHPELGPRHRPLCEHAVLYPVWAVCPCLYRLHLSILDQDDVTQRSEEITASFGSQLLVIGLIQFGLVRYRYLQASSLNLLMAISEALAGAAFLYFAYQQPNPHTG